MSEVLPYETTPEEVRVHLRHASFNPNVRAVYETTLKSGPRTYRFATILEIINRETKEHHHYALTIRSFERTKRYGWREQPNRCITLESRNPDELTQLITFIRSVAEKRFPSADGEYHVLDAATYQELQDILSAARRAKNPEKIELLRLILENIDPETISTTDWRDLLQYGAPQVLHSIATAARMIEYKKSYLQLKRLVEDPGTKEKVLQHLLDDNPWMFGSEYSELLDRRVWTRDSQLDYMLRRSTDGYLEVIEIKTPFREPLFRYDSSHECYFPSARLSEVVGQVIHYIGEIDRSRDSIKARDEHDPLKIRARIIIGRDGEPELQTALRSFNAHLHRVEVITFDQLLRIARRVLTVFAEEAALR